MRRFATALLTLTLGISGAMIAARMWFGPLDSPFPIHSPLNAESVFGIALLLRIALASALRSTPNSAPRMAASHSLWIAVAIAVLIAAVYWRTTGWYFLSDDFIVLKYASLSFREMRSTFTTAGGDGFYRPLIYTSLLWPRLGHDPRAWHLIALLFHFLNSTLVFLLAARLGFSRFVSTVTALLFAVHGTRPEVAIWLTGRFDLFATFFVLFALVLFMESRERKNGWLWNIAALMAMILGLISKESAYATPVVLLVILISTGDWRSKSRRLGYLPFFLAAAAVFGYRWYLLHGIGGYVTAQGTPQVQSLHLTVIAKAMLYRVWAILFFPINWTIQPGAVLGAIGAVYLIALGVASRARVPRERLALIFGILFALLLPVIPVMLIGADLEKARYLYLPAVGFCLLLATVAEHSPSRWTIAAAMLLFQFAALEHNLIAWKAASEIAKSSCEMVARESDGARVAVIGIPDYLDGVQLFANGFRECVTEQHATAQITMLDRDAKPDSSSFDRVYVWDEHARALLPRK